MFHPEQFQIQVESFLEEIGFEQHRQSNGDIPPSFTKKVLLDQIIKYFSGKTALGFVYSLASNLSSEVAYTNPIDPILFQAIHDVENCQENGLPKTKAREVIRTVKEKLEESKQ